MRMIAPEVEEGAGGPCVHVRVAEEQEEYLTISAAIVRHPGHGVRAHLLCFQPSEQERQRIAAGENLYIALLTAGGPMQPILVLCGKREASAVFNVCVTGGPTG